jgi:hypothetical protein
MRNHGAPSHTTAAMVHHPWLQGIETSANMLYIKAMLLMLKLEHIIINWYLLLVLVYFLP